MKKLKAVLSLVLCAAMLFSFAAADIKGIGEMLPLIKASAADVLEYGDFKYTVSNGEVTITEFTDTSAPTEVTIPDRINNYPVTCIGFAAFRSYRSLESVTLPSTLKVIEAVV